MAIQLHAIAGPSEVARNPGPDGAPFPGAAPAAPLMDWRGFHSELQRAAIAATQTGAPLSLLMLELVASGRSGERPDTEPAAPIGGLASVVEAAVGERGCLARYAAERLAVILIDTDLDAATARAESIARSLRAQGDGAAGGIDREASPAIGVAQFRDDESLGHLIQRTANALRLARLAPGLAVLADRGARERPIRALGMAPPRAAAYALKDGR